MAGYRAGICADLTERLTRLPGLHPLEEKMMREEFGDNYRDYCRDVTGLILRLR
jgi:hypothetical protein